MDKTGLHTPHRGGPLVSVIIPTFNRKAWLRAAIESVFSQDYENFEIIVVDDGSTDGTKEALTDIASHSKVKYLYQANTGRPAAARNRGIREAAGSFLVFLDSDDLLLPGSLTTRIDVLLLFPQVGFVSTDWLCFGGSVEDGTRPSVVTASRFIERLPAELIEVREGGVVVFTAPFVYELFNSDFVNTSTVMLRREAVDRVGAFNEALIIGEDYDLWLRVGLNMRMAFIETPLGLLRNHDSHLTRNELVNFEQDALVIRQFLRVSPPVPRKWRKRFNGRMAKFYRTGGLAFLRATDRRNALRFFMMAWRFEPVSIANIKCIVKCLT